MNGLKLTRSLNPEVVKTYLAVIQKHLEFEMLYRALFPHTGL
jgi:hypothetical protein